MSDKILQEYENHVEMIGQFKKRTITLNLKPEFSAYVKDFMELMSSFCWVVMVLWIQSGAFAVYVLIFVSVSIRIDIKLTIDLLKQFQGGLVGKLFCILYATHVYNDKKSPENNKRGQG